MEHDPNRRGQLPSRVPVLRLFGSPRQNILCAPSLVFVRSARKNHVLPFSPSGKPFPRGAVNAVGYQVSPGLAAHSIPNSASLAKVGQPVSGSHPSIW